MRRRCSFGSTDCAIRQRCFCSIDFLTLNFTSKMIVITEIWPYSGGCSNWLNLRLIHFPKEKLFSFDQLKPQLRVPHQLYQTSYLKISYWLTIERPSLIPRGFVCLYYKYCCWIQLNPELGRPSWNYHCFRYCLLWGCGNFGCFWVMPRCCQQSWGTMHFWSWREHLSDFLFGLCN